MGEDEGREGGDRASLPTGRPAGAAAARGYEQSFQQTSMVTQRRMM